MLYLLRNSLREGTASTLIGRTSTPSRLKRCTGTLTAPSATETHHAPHGVNPCEARQMTVYGACRDRTDDPRLAKAVLSQLS